MPLRALSTRRQFVGSRVTPFPSGNLALSERTWQVVPAQALHPWGVKGRLLPESGASPVRGPKAVPGRLVLRAGGVSTGLGRE
jgi:hypothetical protein